MEGRCLQATGTGCTDRGRGRSRAVFGGLLVRCCNLRRRRVAGQLSAEADQESGHKWQKRWGARVRKYRINIRNRRADYGDDGGFANEEKIGNAKKLNT